MIGVKCRNGIGKPTGLSLSPFLLVSLSLLAAGCDLPGKPNPAERPVPANEVLDFATLYAENCAGCHGKDGTWGPAPPLNDPVFLHIVSDEVLRRVVAQGRSGTLMPAFAEERGGTLTMAQVQAVADGLKKQWQPKEKPKVEPPPYESSAEGDAKRGAKVFARACAMCHGEQGEGPAPEMRINDPVFLGLISDQALRRLAITGRPDVGMPDFAGKRGGDEAFKPLSAEEVNDLVAYLATWRPGRTDKRR